VAKIAPFEAHADDYEAWFESHPDIYAAEIEAIRHLLPPFKRGVEIGVGSGRFSLPFGITEGVEPSKKMAEIARRKGIKTITGVAEQLPLEDESYDLVMMVTTICFIDDVRRSFDEIRRILRPGGYVIVGFVDRESPIGRLYEHHRESSRFYQPARFFDAAEVRGLLESAGFGDILVVQTLFGESLQEAESGVKEGFGEGSFVVFRAQKTA
jgi:SAM-dependent methyltransferase